MNERQPEEVEHRELVENSQEFLRAAMAEQMPDALLTAAWDEFYRVYDVLIRRFAVARGVRGADVDDCVQDVWSEIAKRLVGFQITSEAGLRSWLFALVRSRATDMFRRRTRRPLAFLGDSLQEGLEPAGRRVAGSGSADDGAETGSRGFGTELRDLSASLAGRRRSVRSRGDGWRHSEPDSVPSPQDNEKS